MSMDNFCLKWKDFQQNIATSFHNLREDTEFSDVTLVTEDNKQLEAHRIVLTASSPILHNMLKRNKHSHPIIYMRGLNSRGLKSILDFMYHGETNIYQDELDNFLSLADELQLKGLTLNETEKPFEDKENIQNTYENLIEKENVKYIALSKSESSVKLETTKSEIEQFEENDYYKTISADDSFKTSLVAVDNTDDLEQKISSMLTKVNGQWTCTLCQKAVRDKTNMTQHIEAKHIEGVSHSCNMCGKVGRSAYGLGKHRSRYHPGKK